jgi:hypothetical protein
MANSNHSSNRNRRSRAAALSVQDEAIDGRFFGLQWGRVTDNEDPENQGRIIANLEWLEEEGTEFETGWLTRMVPWAGPTKMNRGRKFAFDGPLPEVGSVVGVLFVNGNPADGVYIGQPMYFEDETGAPELDKDKHRDWSLRISLQNGFEIMVDTEGNGSIIFPGNLVVKGLGNSVTISCRGETILMGTDVSVDAMSVLKLRGVTTDQTPYPRPEEKQEVRERTIEMYTGPPGKKDPGINKVKRLGS